MNKKILAGIVVIIIILSVSLLFFFSSPEVKERINQIPYVEITYPENSNTVSKIVTIGGIASDSDGDKTLKKVEVMVDDEWIDADGTTKWSYSWTTYNLKDDFYTIKARAWDGADYSEVEEIKVKVLNPEVVESDSHKWAVFVISANFPEDNKSKLGNGGLYLAEEMAAYFIENYGYPTSNIDILFDDGWIRADNGFGEQLELLESRYHRYDIDYAAATKDNVASTIENVVNQSNNFEDSEVFIWFATHGWGDNESILTGGKILEKSAIFLWNAEMLYDKELGEMLSDLNSKKTCVIVDACFSGGFADRTILDFPTFFLLKSGIPESGRVVISGASKFKVGYANTVEGPLFSYLWFNGIKTGEADGYRPGLFETGRPTKLDLFKDDKVSVEEAFYYARYTLKHDEALKEYSKMEPQINDQYPGSILNSKGLIFG